MPLSNNPTESYWTVEQLLDRVSQHDFSIQEWEILTIARELVRDGRVCALGRPCDDADQPRNQWEPIPAHAVTDLDLPLRPRAESHPGDVFWRSTGKRAYAFVQFREKDLMHEWLGEIFARPRYEMPADIVIPAVKQTAYPPVPSTLAAAFEAYRQSCAGKDISKRGFNRYLENKGLSRKQGFAHKLRSQMWTDAKLPLIRGGRGRKG